MALVELPIFFFSVVDSRKSGNWHSGRHLQRDLEHREGLQTRRLTYFVYWEVSVNMIQFVFFTSCLLSSKFLMLK